MNWVIILEELILYLYLEIAKHGYKLESIKDYKQSLSKNRQEERKLSIVHPIQSLTELQVGQRAWIIDTTYYKFVFDSLPI